jgi:hypothetical protein
MTDSQYRKSQNNRRRMDSSEVNRGDIGERDFSDVSGFRDDSSTKSYQYQPNGNIEVFCNPVGIPIPPWSKTSIRN